MESKIITKKTLSAREIGLLSRLEFEGKEIYTKDDIASFCGNRQKAAYLVKKLLEKKRLKKIIKNVYLFIPMKAPGGKWAGNEYVIAKALVRGDNYYIGYSSVFNSYGFTDQVAQMIHVINERYSLIKKVGGIKYRLIKVSPGRMYGLESRRINKEYIVFASKERALIDAFDFFDVKKAAGILIEQFGKMNVALLVDYAALYPVQIVRRRIGYFLEKLGVSQAALSKIDVGTKGYSPLYDNGVKKGSVDKIWRVIVNG